eukprot:750499-Hanusia_phi.AAC.11
MTRLRLMHFMPGEEIVQKDEVCERNCEHFAPDVPLLQIPREVYFVHIGSVHVIDDQEHVIGVIRNDVPDMAPVVGEVRSSSPFLSLLLLDLLLLFNILLLFFPFNILLLLNLHHHDNLLLCVLLLLLLLLLSPCSWYSAFAFARVPFFLGINHVNTIKARLDGDVQLLVLKQEDSAEIFSNYPEEQLMISENILRSFDLDTNGMPLPGTEEDVHDKQKNEIKRRITESMKTRAEQQFFSLCHAAHVGDVDTVRILIRQGANIDEKNYDGRTVLHIACAEGNYRMVLLNHGADKNIKDRWGNTPLQEAISHKQTLIVGLLTQWKASLGIDNPASALCTAAGSGDLAQVRRLIENGVQPDLGDYDNRTALHVASAEGHEKIVEYLLAHKADPSVQDRWKGTPLQDALLNGHSLVATLLKAKGGSMPQDVGVEEMCAAASSGDLRKLRLMHEYGTPVDVGDYDFRYPCEISSLLLLSPPLLLHLLLPLIPLILFLLFIIIITITILSLLHLLPLSLFLLLCDLSIVFPFLLLPLLLLTAPPVHLAAAEARILAVNFLLGVSADPGCKDRWGGTPLDDTLRGGTLYHRYCGKLIQSECFGLERLLLDMGDAERLEDVYVREDETGWGGELGVYKDTAEGKDFLQEIESISIADVRLLIKKLIEKGFDKKSPNRLSDDELHAWYISSSKHAEIARDLIAETSSVSKDLASVADKVRELTLDMKKTITTMLSGSEQVKPMTRSISIDVGDSVGMELSVQRPIRGWDAGKSFRASFNLGSLWGSDLEETHNDSSPDLRLLNSWAVKAPERGEVKGAWNIPPRLLKECKEALVDMEKSLREEQELEYEGELDSDEEMALYEELDQLLEAQESIFGQGMKWEKVTAIAFRSLALRLVEMEASFELVKGIFCDEGGGDGIAPANISSALERLAISTETMEVDEIIDEAKKSAESEGDSSKMSLTDVLSRSGKLRKLLMEIKVDDVTLKLMTSMMGGLLDEGRAKKLAGASKKKYWRKDEVIYDASQDKKRWMLLLLEGKASMVMAEEQKELVGNERTRSTTAGELELTSGCYFGCYQALTGCETTFVVKATTETSVVLQVAIEEVLELLTSSAEQGQKDFLYNMSEYVYNQKILHLVPDFTINNVPVLQRTRTERPRTAHPAPSESPLKFERASSSSSLTNVKQHGGGDKVRERKKLDKISLVDRERVRSLFFSLHDLWKKLSLGSNSVLLTHLQSIQPLIGESGLQCFLDVFEVEQDDQHNDVVTCQEFWRRWMTFLEPSSSAKEERDGEEEEEEEGEAKKRNVGEREVERREGDDDEDVKASKRFDWMSKIGSKIGSKKLANEFGHANLTVWEKEYIQIMGNLSDPIPNHKIKRFLSRVYSDRKSKITEYNCEEFRDFFDRETVVEDKLTWGELSKVVREKRSAMERSAIFMGSALNPYSSFMSSWKVLMRYVSYFEFVLDPIRIGFLPWSSITSSPELCSRLIPDALLYLHVLIETNTAYKNSKSVWITDRSKILRKIDLVIVAAVFPLDWFAHFCGASYEVCCWLRLNKVLLVRARFHQSSSNMRRYQARKGYGMIHTLGKIILATLHISACTWYFLGRSYRYWFPQYAISWNFVSPKYVNETYPRGEVIGTEKGSTTWEQYLLCFYWVSTTLTVNGAVGELIPQNVVEIGFTIMLMCLNMTLFRVIVGEVSTLVMKKDEDVVKMREQMEVVDSFVSNPTFSPQLKDEIRNHFHAIRSGSSLDQAIIFKDLSHGLRVEIARFISREYLDSVELFKDCSDHLLDDVCILLCEVSFAPEEHLFNVSEGKAPPLSQAP